MTRGIMGRPPTSLPASLACWLPVPALSPSQSQRGRPASDGRSDPGYSGIYKAESREGNLSPDGVSSLPLHGEETEAQGEEGTKLLSYGVVSRVSVKTKAHRQVFSLLPLLSLPLTLWRGPQTLGITVVWGACQYADSQASLLNLDSIGLAGGLGICISTRCPGGVLIQSFHGPDFENVGRLPF